MNMQFLDSQMWRKENKLDSPETCKIVDLESQTFGFFLQTPSFQSKIDPLWFLPFCVDVRKKNGAPKTIGYLELIF